MQCYGLADWRREVAQAGGSPSALGANPAYANGLAELFWEGFYPKCRSGISRNGAGRPLDLRPREPAWP